MSANNSDITDFFLVEADEHLQTINADLLSLEKHKTDLGLVDKIFREVHAIKGSAGMIGFSAVSQFAHKIEDLLAKMRDRKLGVSAAAVDLLFQTVDILAQQIEQISNGQETEDSILVTFDDLYAEFLGRPELSNAQAVPQKKAAPELSERALAELYIKEDLFDKAAAIYRQMLRVDPSNSTIRQMLAETLALQAYVKETSSS